MPRAPLIFEETPMLAFWRRWLPVPVPRDRRAYRPRVEWLETRDLLSAGSLDPTFGTQGKVIASLDGKLDTINAAALQADGKVIVVGASGQQVHPWQIVHEFLIARFNPDGSLDHGFGSNGWVTFNFGAVDS